MVDRRGAIAAERTLQRPNSTTVGMAVLTVLAVLFVTPSLYAQQTTFTFGGYVKFDALHSKYYDGDVEPDSPLRDIHFPAAIPVGSSNNHFVDLDYHAKESRFNLATLTQLPNGQSVRAFVELDFLLAGQGDERVSNSFNPRLRHFYFTYTNWLFGQTWSTFMILDPIVDDLDFGGTADGFIFNRQPQIRFTSGGVQLAFENPEITLDDGTGTRITTEAAALPDMVARYNFRGGWGSLSVAAMGRQLKHEFDNAGTLEANNAFGFAGTVGGRINVGRDDIRFQASAGAGLGRYAAFNFANAAIVDAQQQVTATHSYLGFVGYRHLWSDVIRSNINVSGIHVDNKDNPMPTVNKRAYSGSINVIWAPVAGMEFGVEFMRAYRELENGTRGKFDRMQFSAKYAFSFSASTD